MTDNPVRDAAASYIRQIQHQQMELAILKAQLETAERERDRYGARFDAMATLVDALVGSLRPYGFSRRNFLSAIRKAARTIPDHGPEAVKHTILFEGSNRILKAPTPHDGRY